MRFGLKMGIPHIAIALSLASTPLSLRQNHSGNSSSMFNSPFPSPITSSSVDSPLCSSITPSLFHSRLKTYLFHKSYPLHFELKQHTYTYKFTVTLEDHASPTHMWSFVVAFNDVAAAWPCSLTTRPVTHITNTCNTAETMLSFIAWTYIHVHITLHSLSFPSYMLSVSFN